MSELPTQPHRGRVLDARLHLLDRQLLDDAGDPAGIVDDLEISAVEFDKDIPKGSDAPQVTSLLSGHVVATRVFGGMPPRSRLQGIPWDLVASVSVVVTLKPTDVPLDSGWMERWLCDRVIKHIPGGRHVAE
jgi:hypothetical protein